MNLFRRRRDRELVEEIDTHLSLLEEQFRGEGLSPERARDAARRSFGGVLKTRQAYHEQGGWRALDTLMQDVRFGWRMLLRDRAFALTAIVVLGLGIGVNNLQFTIIYTHTLRPLPIAQAGRVMMASFLDQQAAERSLSYLEYRDLKAGATLFEDLAALGPTRSVALADPGQAPDRYLAAYTTANAFASLRVAPLLGRTFTEGEELPGAALAAMLDEAVWRERYGADPDVVGREVSINGQPATIVGVFRDRSGFPSTAQMLLQLAHAPGFSADRREAPVLRAFGRVRDGESVDEAQAQLYALLQQMAARASGVLKDGGWGGARRASYRWLSMGFMTAQLALSVVLLSYIALNVATRRDLPRSDDVIRMAPVLTASLSLPNDRYGTPERRIEFFRRLDESVRAMPGVVGASISSHLPRTGGVERRVQQDGAAAAEALPRVVTATIGPGYFAALGLPMSRGREFNALDAPGSPATAIVDERFVEMFLDGADPIGRVISLAPASASGIATSATIVGVAPNVRQRDALSEPVVYFSLATNAPAMMSLLVRSAVEPASMTAQLRQKVLELDPNLPLFQVMTMAAVIDNADWVSRVSTRLITALSVIVLLLSSVGLYAVTAHGVSSRSKEIGIRIAVGAQPRQIRQFVLRGAALQVALGLFCGLLATFAWDSAFFSGRIEARLARPGVLLPVGAVFAVVMCAASLLPVRRAAGLDPLVTLRND